MGPMRSRIRKAERFFTLWNCPTQWHLWILGALVFDQFACWIQKTSELIAAQFTFFLKIEDCTLQIYRQNGSDAEYGAYLDLDQSLDEQSDDFDAIKDNKRTTILLRTQLSVRVHTCVGKLAFFKDLPILSKSLYTYK